MKEKIVFKQKQFHVSLCQKKMRKLRLIILMVLLAGSYSRADEATEDSAPIEKEKLPKVLELSLEQAISMALEENLQLRIQEFNPQLDEFRYQDALAGYIPQLRGSINWRDDSSPGGINPATNESFPSNITKTITNDQSVEGILPTGTSYTVGFNTARREGAFIPLTNRNTGNLQFFLSQPLLRNLWIDTNRRFIRVSRMNLEMSYSQFELNLMQIVRDVEYAYYDLIASHENVKVQQKALELGETTLSENRAKIRVGVMAPLDETEAESVVASSKASLIQANQTLKRSENALKRLISDDFAEIYKTKIIPTEKLETKEFDFDVYASWSRGLVERPEIVQSRINIDSQDIEIKFAKNQMFPQLDLVASYSLNGLDQEYGGVWGDFRQRNDPSTLVGLRYSIPLNNRGPKNRYKLAKAQHQIFILQLKDLEQRIQAEIADAVDSATSAKEQVIARSEARNFAEKALGVEQVKLEKGRSTDFVVLRLQRDLTQAQADEISAMVTYRRALTLLAFCEATILERNNVFINSRQREPSWLKSGRKNRYRSPQ